jgi:hypothetical protein
MLGHISLNLNIKELCCAEKNGEIGAKKLIKPEFLEQENLGLNFSKVLRISPY